MSAPPDFDWAAELARKLDLELTTFGQQVVYTPQQSGVAFTLTVILQSGARQDDSSPGIYALLLTKLSAFVDPPVRGEIGRAHV